MKIVTFVGQNYLKEDLIQVIDFMKNKFDLN